VSLLDGSYVGCLRYHVSLAISGTGVLYRLIPPT
jgi:hypothetical protein